MKRGRVEMSLRDALKVPNFNVLDFDLDEQAEGEVPFMKQVAYAAQEIRPLITQDTSEPTAVEATSSIPMPTKGAAGSSGSQAVKKSILDDVDSDPEVRSLDEALQHPPSSASLKSKGIMSDADLKPLVRKRKSETSQILSSDPLPMPRPKKNKRGSSYSTGDVMIELDEHLTGGKFSREEAARARSAPTPSFSGGFLHVSEVESMEVENPETTGKGDEKSRGEPKVVTFSGTNLDSSLGPDRFIDDEEDQVSSLPPSWFGPELMSFLRYAEVFSDDMEIDPATAEEKFIPDWDIQNEDSVMDELVARTLLFNISTPLDHARSQKSRFGRHADSGCGAKDCSAYPRSPVPAREIKSLTTQSQSSQTAAASAAEDRDRISAELKNFSESLEKKDEEHKVVLAKMEESFANARLAYGNMMAGEADLKAQIEEMKGNHEAEIEEIKKENTALKATVDDLQATKTWLLSDGAKLLAKNIHKGLEMSVVVAAVNNAMSTKTPYAEFPLLNRNAGEELNAAVACFDSLTFPVIEDLPKLVNEPLSKIKEDIFYASEESFRE
ncbi:hypothetical protein Hanom_Chr08g00750681 [Helianthus anomalus]